MIATVGVMVLLAALTVAAAGGWVVERHRRHTAAAQARTLRVEAADRAETLAEAILGRHGLPPMPRLDPLAHHRPPPDPPRLPAAVPLAGWVAGLRDRPRLVGAGLAATVVAGLLAVPLLSAGRPDPGVVDPPPYAGPAPVEQVPDRPLSPWSPPDVPSPGAEPQPAPEGEPPAAVPADQPAMERVAVVEPEPTPPAAGQPPVPGPAPEPEPSPEPPAPVPEPPPEPSPEPPAEPDPPEGGDPALLCVDLELLTLAELRLCLL